MASQNFLQEVGYNPIAPSSLSESRGDSLGPLEGRCRGDGPGATVAGLLDAADAVPAQLQTLHAKAHVAGAPSGGRGLNDGGEERREKGAGAGGSPNVIRRPLSFRSSRPSYIQYPPHTLSHRLPFRRSKDGQPPVGHGIHGRGDDLGSSILHPSIWKLSRSMLMGHSSAQNENRWQKCLVDSDYKTFLINILSIIWQTFSHCIIISARDMATLICKFWEP